MLIGKVFRKIIQKKIFKNSKHNIITNNKFCFELSAKEKRFCFNNGFTFSEYGVYRANSDNISNYISSLDSYLPRHHNGELMIASDNKLLFPYVFGKYFTVAENFALVMNGSIIPLNDSGLNEKTIFEFLKTKDLIIKPYNGYDGKGIHKLHFDSSNDSIYMNDSPVEETVVLKEISELDKYIIQERLIQHPFFDSLYPKSLNTIRVISAKTGALPEHEILCAVQRIGTDRSAPADNFSKGGLSAKIDIETGKYSKATGGNILDDNGRRVFFSQHPNTGGQIENKIVPKWDYIKYEIKRFTREFPMYNFIAWDLCLNKNDQIIVIETNMKSSLDVFQVHGGMKGTKLDMVLQSYKTKGE